MVSALPLAFFAILVDTLLGPIHQKAPAHMPQKTTVVSTGGLPLTFDWENTMNSSSFVHYIRDQVIFIGVTTIATILLFTLGLMAAASLEGKAQTAGIVGAVVIGLWLLVASLGTIRRLQLLSESIPEEEQDTPFARDFKKNPWPLFFGLAIIVQVGVAYALITAFTA